MPCHKNTHATCQMKVKKLVHKSIPKTSWNNNPLGEPIFPNTIEDWNPVNFIPHQLHAVTAYFMTGRLETRVLLQKMGNYIHAGTKGHA